jgi:type VI secretion system secreted protein VgrG
MSQSNGLKFTALVGDLPKDLFAVVSFRLTESLSSLFKGTLELASTDPSVSADEVLEQPVELVVWDQGIPLRRFHGVVQEFARNDTGHRRTRYQLIIQPPLWRLGLMHNSRIFQTQTTDAIVRTLLEERGIVDSVFDLKRSPEEREYCVQHRESDLAFIERLAAEEGWHYRYNHGDVAGEEQPGLIIADHHGDAPVLEPATYNALAGGSTRQSAVLSFRYQERVRVSSAVLKDYTFKNPAYALMHEENAASHHHREDYQHYDYPGRYKADASGKPFTEARLDALRNDANTAAGTSNRADVAPGARLPLEGHDNQSFNREWLITGVIHEGEQPQAMEEEGGSGATTYHNTFQAIPADKTWRPAIPNRPVMDGPQMAIVTGPAGEEIHCDEHGRVKVRFPWDRRLRPAEGESSKNDEHSSAWLRVSQGWAGGQYGFMALPRIGHEVIVSFLDGDPDQPIITGRTWHATNTPPYALPEHKTRTTLKTKTHKGEGSNELRFEDEAGEEQIYVHAQKDLDLLTQNNRTEVVNNDSHLTVGNNRHTHVKANDDLTIEGEKKEQTAANHSFIVNGTLHLSAGTAWLTDSGTELHIKAGQKAVIEAGAEITLMAGGSIAKIDPAGVHLIGAAIKLNAGGAPGVGGGVKAQAAEMPRVVATNGGAVEPPALAEVGQRASAPALSLDNDDLLNLAEERAPAQQLCQKKRDGECNVRNCPCEA